MFYICSAVQTAGEMATPGSKWTEGQFYIGGVIAGAAWTESTGTFTAIDALSGERKWQKEFPEACYAGTSTTKGNLVFLGRNNGELEAYDARDGNRLWNFQTGAGANNTATVFEHDGNQYVLFLSQGNSLQATAHGDELWLFGLDGTIGPATAAGGGAGTEHGGQGGEERPPRATPRPARPSSRRTAPAATARRARAATAAPTCRASPTRSA